MGTKDGDTKLIDLLLKNPKQIKDKTANVESLLNNNKRMDINGSTLLVASSTELDHLFIIFLYYYNHTVASKSKINHVSIDLEFNSGVMALIQLNFGKYVWIINPQNYQGSKKRKLVKYLFCRKNIYKVLHGSDALDLHHIYKFILDDDKENIIKFTHKWIDTRFLCEYLRSSLDEEGKCGIYDGMLYTNTITKDIYDDLTVNTSIMEPGDDVMWDVTKLNDTKLKYAYSDVLYLTQFLLDIYKQVETKTPQYKNTYYYIFQIIRFITLERRNITDIIQKAKGVIDKMNNYIIRIGGQSSTILALYNKTMDGYVINYKEDGQSLTIDIKFIQSINYSRTMFNVLLKYVFYHMLSKKFKIFVNKRTPYTGDIDLKYLYDLLDSVKMRRINKLLQLYLDSINKIRF